MCPAARHCGHLFFGPQLAGGNNWCRCCGLTLLASLQSLPRRSFSRNHRSTSTSVTYLANCSVGTPRIFLAISRQVGGPLIHYCCPADGPHVDDRLLCQGSPRQLVEEDSDDSSRSWLSRPQSSTSTLRGRGRCIGDRLGLAGETGCTIERVTTSDCIGTTSTPRSRSSRRTCSSDAIGCQETCS
jgi:hypothetical protein